MRLSEIVKNLSSEARELNSESIAACDVAAASYTASYVLTYILLELDRLRVGFKIPTFVSKGGEIYRDFSSRIKQASWSHPSHEASKKPVAIAEKPAAAVLPETSPSHEFGWRCYSPLGFIPVLPSTLRSAIFTRLARHFVPRAFGTTGLKSPNQTLRNRGGYIENT